ncbi:MULTISPECIES: hypothetical protein [unclassified Streptomyces]|uniref:hypothetical protein n=1 Tax=unclassified Streptomyces TaxID=2593676 RepID=UPI002E37FD30|nr:MULTISPECIES: hypothetical protein [unclassified Streptomyces]WUC65055.1 hypothetical protein OG861_12845 [Streptomyces sp. NBC_00539]
MSAAGAARAATGAGRAPGTAVSVGALLASCAAADAVSRPPARIPVRPLPQDGAAGGRGAGADAAGAHDAEQAAPASEAA